MSGVQGRSILFDSAFKEIKLNMISQMVLVTMKDAIFVVIIPIFFSLSSFFRIAT
jgi:hypothetical protein